MLAASAIMQVYSQLEESNLFLIQNSQETEEELEELKGKFREARARLDAEVEGLQVKRCKALALFDQYCKLPSLVMGDPHV
jgi:chromosome segregation ATPase